MTDESIAPDLREFILTHIESIAHLEALLLLRRDLQIKWDAGAVAKRLYISAGDAAAVLERLRLLGLLLADDNGDYRYHASGEHAQKVDRLAESYSRHLIQVTNLIHARRMNRIQEFADAFKLRKDD